MTKFEKCVVGGGVLLAIAAISASFMGVDETLELIRGLYEIVGGVLL